MKKECFSIRDDKMGTFNSPFFTSGVVDALRSVTIAANQTESNLNRFSEDFSLFKLCSLDEDTGLITQTQPELITPISKLLKK